MFNQKSNVTCKNILFNQTTMHTSMEKLYRFVSETKRITGQTAVAVELGETPQTLNNWEARGISQRGANSAQKKFGCDANWLLGVSSHPRAAIDKPAAPPQTVEEPTAYFGWPFKEVKPAQYATLDEEQKADVEKYVMLQIRTREPPEKLNQPANTVAHNKAA